MRRDLRNSHHLATISYDGRFWDAYLEILETQGAGQPVRGRIAFSAADAGDADPVRTTTIFIEDTPQEVVVRAREFKTHQLVALLRSSIPADPADEESEAPTGDAADDDRLRDRSGAKEESESRSPESGSPEPGPPGAGSAESGSD